MTTTLFPTEPVALDQLEVFAVGLDHSEGITVSPAGKIYVGGEAGQIYRIDDDKPVEIANTKGFLLGLASDAHGRIYVIDSTHRKVWRYDESTGDLETFSTGIPGIGFKVPNWGAFDALGNYFLTDSGNWMDNEGLIYVVRPGGRVELWTDEVTAFPNGCCVSPDGSTLYVVESVPGAIVEVPISKSGGAGTRRVLCELGMAVPDGVAVASDGSLIVACYRPDVIYRWHPSDGLSILAADPRGTILSAPTNAVFTGPNLEILVVPNLGRWNLTRGNLGITGMPLHYPDRAAIGS